MQGPGALDQAYVLDSDVRRIFAPVREEDEDLPISWRSVVGEDDDGPPSSERQNDGALQLDD